MFPSLIAVIKTAVVCSNSFKLSPVKVQYVNFGTLHSLYSHLVFSTGSERYLIY
jgi:hypothetical protein